MSDVCEACRNGAPDWMCTCDVEVFGNVPKAEPSLELPLNPPEEMWDGLPRQIMMWLDFGAPTPANLFKHLERSGWAIPDWLRDEPEMKALNHVPSKGTRCVLIYRAMVENWIKARAALSVIVGVEGDQPLDPRTYARR